MLPQPLMKYIALKKKISYVNRHGKISSAKEGWEESWAQTLGNLDFIGPAGREYFATNWLMPPNQGWPCGIHHQCNDRFFKTKKGRYPDGLDKDHPGTVLVLVL